MDKKSLAANISSAREERRRFENLKNILTEEPEPVALSNFRNTRSFDKTQKIGQVQQSQTRISSAVEEPLVKSNTKARLLLAEDSSDDSVDAKPNVITLQVNHIAEIQDLKSNLKLLSKGELISVNKKLLHNLKNMMEKAKTVAEDSCATLKHAYEAKLEKEKRKVPKLKEKLDAVNKTSKQAIGKAEKAKSKLNTFQEEFKMLEKKYTDVLSKLSLSKDNASNTELALNRERARNAELESEMSAMKKQSLNKDSVSQETASNIRQLRETLNEKSNEISRLKDKIAQLSADVKASEEAAEQVLSSKQELELVRTSYSALDVF